MVFVSTTKQEDVSVTISEQGKKEVNKTIIYYIVILDEILEDSTLVVAVVTVKIIIYNTDERTHVIVIGPTVEMEAAYEKHEEVVHYKADQHV